MLKSLLITLILVVSQVIYSQTDLWSVSSINISQQGYELKTSSDVFLDFDIQSFKSKFLNDDGFVLMLPINETEKIAFQLNVNTLMPKALRDKYTNIRAYNGIALDRSKRTAKVEIGPNYFRVMISTPGKENIYIDPVVFTKNEQTHYVLYTKSQLLRENDFQCHFTNNDEQYFSDDLFAKTSVQTCELRTYRVAIAATGEYTAFHGGTKELALAAEVTTLNRVNQIYENDLAITLVMIPNIDTLIYIDAATDPYTNGAPDLMISENITNINDIIGVTNFDIGHVFGTDSGGLANLNAVCKDNMKAGGVTGSSAPINDPFDIDYVAHEMGHQFGANHTFNSSCSGNRNGGTAMEPGSGSTILGYAGVCPPNVQNNSDAYFHAISLKEIGTAISGPSHTCAVKTPLSNSAPQITSVTNINIPSGTPFILTGSATDVDDNALTYCWEQMDKDIATQPPVASAVKGPSFRSFLPKDTSIRYVPSPLNIATPSYKWEVLSTGARIYKFRLTVRDNAPGGGCTDFKDITVKTDANSGPFLITYPTATGIVWNGATIRTVTWDVANTDQAPINCQNVRILFSSDKGATFTTLVESTPNTGSVDVEVPNISSATCLIMVQSEDGTFFTSSSRNFRIIKGNVSTNEVVKQKFSLNIYPNPATNVVKLNLSGVESIDGYVLYNSLGQKVLVNDGKMTNNSEINIKSLSAGIYFFQAMIGNEKVTKKLIKN